jgi:hypothetical protein
VVPHYHLLGSSLAMYARVMKIASQEKLSPLKWQQFLEEFQHKWSPRGVHVIGAEGPAELANRLRPVILSKRRAEREVEISLRDFKEKTLLAA